MDLEISCQSLTLLEDHLLLNLSSDARRHVSSIFQHVHLLVLP